MCLKLLLGVSEMSDCSEGHYFIVKKRPVCDVCNKTLSQLKLEEENQRLTNLLEDVVNELDLSELAIEEHGPLGTAPSELVRLVLEEKDMANRCLRAGMKQIKEQS